VALPFGLVEFLHFISARNWFLETMFTYVPWLSLQAWMDKASLFAAIQLQYNRPIWLRALKRRDGDKQDLAFDHKARIHRLSLRSLIVDLREGDTEALMDILKDTLMRLERVNLEVDQCLFRNVEELDSDGHGAERAYGVQDMVAHNEANLSERVSGSGVGTQSRIEEKGKEGREVAWPRNKKVSCRDEGAVQAEPENLTCGIVYSFTRAFALRGVTSDCGSVQDQASVYLRVPLVCADRRCYSSIYIL
jgi:hypothetical protein